MSRRKTVRMNNLVPDSKQLMKVKMFLNKNCVTKLQKMLILFILCIFRRMQEIKNFLLKANGRPISRG